MDKFVPAASIVLIAMSASPTVFAATATSTTVVEPAATNAAPLVEIDQRIKRIERLLDNQVMLEMLQRVEALQQEVRELRGELEQQGFEVQSMRKRQRDLYLDSDRRLRDLELTGGNSTGQTVMSGDTTGSDAIDASSTTPPPATLPSTGLLTTTGSVAGDTGVDGASPSSVAVDAALPPVNPVQEKAAYTKAFNYLKEGRYEGAIKAFTGFLQEYPNGNYADNAQYWLGEANYVSRFFDVAIEEFDTVLAKYPGSPKISDARLKIGYAHYELEDWKAARSALTALANDFPNTSVARLANKRLARMRDEGH